MPVLPRFEYRQLHMGVAVRLVVYAPSEDAAVEACRAAYARVAELDQIMSDYRPTSELMRLCRRAGQGPVKVSQDLFAVLEKAQEMSRRSAGAFDVTCGPMVQLWRAARKEKKLPPAEAIAEAKQRVGWEKVKLDPAARTVELSVPGMKLDLGGIAKGYAGDQALAVLRERGIQSAYFEGGGDIVVSDAPPGEEGWAIELTDDLHPDRAKVIRLKNRSISTSGDTEQFVEIDGVRYSHVVDPRTGIGLQNRLMVSVIAPDGVTSDPLSTAVGVLGEEKGLQLARTYPSTEIVIRRAR